MKENILQRIGADKQREVEAMRQILPLGTLAGMAEKVKRPVLSMTSSILHTPGGIIAEHKRRSPSKGEISPLSDVGAVAEAYAGNGAAAMSVLTDTPYFGGSLEDLAVARLAAPRLPMLRKEFIVDEYQIYQARLYGADAILLIAAMLGEDDIRRFNDIAHSLGLQTLVEVHSLQELKAVPEDADMVGVNNRDLTSFSTDIRNAAHLAGRLPDGMVKIAESGIKTPEDVERLREEGFDGFLIGEAFMSTPCPGDTLRNFII